MPKFLSLLLVAVTGLVFASSAMAASTTTAPCQSYVPEIDVIPIFGHVKRDMTLRAVALDSPDAWGALKIDHVAAANKISTRNTFRHLTEGKEMCIVLDNISVIYRIDPELRLSDLFPPDSCQAQQQKLHEQKHVDLAKAFQTNSTDTLRAYLQQVLQGHAAVPLYDKRVEDMESYLNALVDTQLAEYARYLNTELKTLQDKAVDAPDQAAAMFAACPGWQAPALQ